MSTTRFRHYIHASWGFSIDDKRQLTGSDGGHGSLPVSLRVKNVASLRILDPMETVRIASSTLPPNPTGVARFADGQMELRSIVTGAANSIVSLSGTMKIGLNLS